MCRPSGDMAAAVTLRTSATRCGVRMPFVSWANEWSDDRRAVTKAKKTNPRKQNVAAKLESVLIGWVCRFITAKTIGWLSPGKQRGSGRRWEKISDVCNQLRSD